MLAELWLVGTHGLLDKCYCPGDSDVTPEIKAKIKQMINTETAKPAETIIRQKRKPMIDRVEELRYTSS